MEYVNIHISFTLNLAVTKNPWVMEKNDLHIWIQR